VTIGIGFVNGFIDDEADPRRAVVLEPKATNEGPGGCFCFAANLTSALGLSGFTVQCFRTVRCPTE
jgi:hypothetical protein